MMIRWCLYLHHLSTGAYETLCSCGAVTLPSQRTLRDYTHFIQATSGFSHEVDEQLIDLASIGTCPEREKYVVVLMDEMHIKQSLMYNKHSGMHNITCCWHQSTVHMHFLGVLIGYTDLGDINVHLDRFQFSLEEANEEEAGDVMEEEDSGDAEAEASEKNMLAESMLVLLVRGLFSNLKPSFPVQRDLHIRCLNLSGML